MLFWTTLRNDENLDRIYRIYQDLTQFTKS